MKTIGLFGALIVLCSSGGIVASAAAKSAGGAAAAGAHGGMGAGGRAFFHAVRPVSAGGLAARRAFLRNDLRRGQTAILPYWPTSGDFDPFYYYPGTDAAFAQSTGSSTASGDPVAPSQVPPNRVLVVQPGCRTQDQKVRSEAGGEALVHITRCY